MHEEQQLQQQRPEEQDHRPVQSLQQRQGGSPRRFRYREHAGERGGDGGGGGGSGGLGTVLMYAACHHILFVSIHAHTPTPTHSNMISFPPAPSQAP